MTTFQIPERTLAVDAQSSTTPLVVLFERDDAIAVPLLSQLRIAGYDVRAARTPVELFDITSKQRVALILIDLGSATAGRREFWVALDTQRRGRSIQVMTFRYTSSDSVFDTDFEPSARAIADIEVQGAHQFQVIIEEVRQRVPLNSLNLLAAPDFDPLLPPPALRPALQPGIIPPIGAALGVPSPFMSMPPGALGMPGGLSAPDHQFGGAGPESSSPFAHPASSNPFIETGDLSSSPYVDAAEESPFAQPYSTNPFAAAAAPSESQSLPTPPVASHAFSYQMAASPPVGSFEERAARLSEAYASQFGIEGTFPMFPAADSAPGAIGLNGASPPNLMAKQSGQPGEFGESSGQPPSGAWGAAEFFDAWTPPGVDESEWRSMSQSGAPAVPTRLASADSDDRETAFTTTEYAPALLARSTRGAETGRQGGASAYPSGRQGMPTEESLGSVLVEGALLSEQKLEALRGVQQMLSNVEIDFKLGELALLFKVLSPDQLLAALLVSRGLVTPQQIASLGRTKQDLASTGMDYTLADLLTMFGILPEEQVRRIREEISG